MKESWRKDALRNIRKRIISWLSIVTIVVISAGIILGICFPMYTLKKTSDEYFKAHNFKDADIASSVGVKASDVDIIKHNCKVKEAEGAIILPGVVSSGKITVSAKIISLTEKVSVPYAIKGELPAAINECAISKEIADALSIDIGDELSFEMSNSRFEDALNEKSFKVTGIAGHPDFFGADRDGFCIVPHDVFNTDALSFDYTSIFVDADIPDSLNTMQKEYLDKAAELKDELEMEGDEIAARRKGQYIEDLDNEYAKAVKKVEDELANGKSKLDDAQKEFDEKISKAEKELEDGESEFADAKQKAEKELADGEKKIRDGEAEYNAQIADGEKQLADAKKQLEDELNDAKYKLFYGFLELDNAEKTLIEKEQEYTNGVIQLNAGREELNKGWDEYDDGLYQIETYLNDSNIDSAVSFLELVNENSEIQIPGDVISEIRSMKDCGTIKRFGKVVSLLDRLPNDIKNEFMNAFDFDQDEGSLRDKYNQLKGAEDKLNDAEDKIRSGAEELNEGRRLLDQGWFSLEQGKKELADGQAELERKEPEARKLLSDKEAEFEEKKEEGARQIAEAKRTFKKKKKEALDKLAKAEKELADGRAEFESEKKKGEAELKKARDEYEKEKKEAYAKLDDAKEVIENAKNIDVHLLVQMREANLNFIELKSYVDVLTRFIFVFMPIFCSITVIVCFFTIAIIVEEQKKQIGVVKAFGGYKNEIRNKYIIFGVSAAMLGVIIGVAGGFALEALIVNSLKETFLFEDLSHKTNPIPVAITFGATVILTTFVVIWSCEKYISCSATGLLNGSEPENKIMKRAAKSDRGSIYIRMIINNFYTDLGRVIISVVIVLSCCMLIGLGITLKDTFDTTLKEQMNSLWKYDLKIVMQKNATDTEKTDFLDAIQGYDYCPVYRVGTVMQAEKEQALAEVYCVDDSNYFKEFITLKNKKGDEIDIPKEGVLVTEEMKEKDELPPGTEFTMVTDDLKISKVYVKDNFLQYFGKCGIMSRDYFVKIFEDTVEDNCYFIKAGNNTDALYEKLQEYPAIETIDKVDSLKEKNKTLIDLFDIIVYLVLAFSLILSFMILLNLSNILVLRRMRELLTMRVNGFSNGQVIGYLAREIIVTTSMGIILGVATGIPITLLCIKTMETDGFMYVSRIYPSAWALAGLSCFAFAALINSISFRKIGKVPLTDITKY
ncbi:FtsX-like permease family protein [Butyrivibrio sp. AC2005]|uniref:FtsX-like permease family protein n=1 Tax=Butyrivibrio sp. AC2005 TaxID=1280672 RepID=UPI000416EDE8|nr:FtsX-like permease family protein [Butyrivibrio sp. AC2005]